MNTNDIWLIAGLGNPEAKYDGTRHNAGFAALDYLSGQPAELTLQKRSGADHCYDFSADLQAADGTTTASVTGTITMVKEDGAWKASDLTLNLK